MALNILAGSLGKTGGIALHQEIPSAIENKNPYRSIHCLPDHSVRILILDESLSGSPLPNKILQQKLTENGIIVSLSPLATARPFATQYMIPSSVVYETLTDVTGSFDHANSSLSLSASLLPSPEGTIDAIQFAQRLAQAIGVTIESGTTEDVLKKRIAALHRSNRGSIFNAITGQISEVKTLSSPDDLWNALLAGGCWMNDTASVKILPEFTLKPQLAMGSFKQTQRENKLAFVPRADNTPYDGKDISPLMSKVRRESNLRQE